MRSIGVVLLHPGCNMKCSFCVTGSDLSAMRLDQALGLFDMAEARGMDNLVLGGGEPFTWGPGVLRYAQAAKERGFFVQIGTNGIALPEGFESNPSVDRYVLPLDGADAGGHDRVRHFGGGHFDLVRGRMARLREAGKPMTVSTVVTAWNIDALAEIAVLLADEVLAGARLHAWHLYRFIPEGRGGRRNAEALWVEEEPYDEACAGVKDRGLGFTIFKRKDMRHSKTVDFFWYEGESLRVGSQVWAGTESISAPRLVSPR